MNISTKNYTDILLFKSMLVIKTKNYSEFIDKRIEICKAIIINYVLLLNFFSLDIPLLIRANISSISVGFTINGGIII